jgi:hypothetical protein
MINIILAVHKNILLYVFPGFSLNSKPNLFHKFCARTIASAYFMLYKAKILKWIAKILRIGSYSESLPMPGHRRRSKSMNPNSKDRNRFAASVLRPYFSVPPSGDIHIARQADQKNPIRNPTRLC